MNSFTSRQLEDYGDQKGIYQTTAKVEFLGAKIMKDKGLSCKFVIAVVSRMAIRKEKKLKFGNLRRRESENNNSLGIQLAKSKDDLEGIGKKSRGS